MKSTTKTIILVAIVVVAGAFAFWSFKNQSGSKEAANVYVRESKALSEEDKARMRAGWTYDVKAKVWYDENFRPVGKDAKPPTVNSN